VWLYVPSTRKTKIFESYTQTGRYMSPASPVTLLIIDPKLDAVARSANPSGR
jgi:hypothetical protein